MKRKLLSGLVIVACLFASLHPAVGGAAAEGLGGKNRAYAVWWTVASVEGPRTFKARVKAYYRCGRQKQPLVTVAVRERPNRAIIRMVRHWPGDMAKNCINTNPLGTEKTVSLHRPLRKLEIFDASKSPPQRRRLPWERR